MNIITEKELIEYLAITEAAEAGVGGKKADTRKGVKEFRIEEQEDGRFVLVMDLLFKPGIWILTTARKTPRYYPNLNTLADFLKGLELPDVLITLKLRGSDEK